MPIYDVIIIGGGPAGLSAALILARCRRKLLLFDDGRPRNAAASATHGYLTRDGIAPGELLRLGREEVGKYGVEIRGELVTSARCLPQEDSFDHATAFSVTTQTGETFMARKLLLATGVADVLPDLPNVKAFYGRGVHHCPYCDGWEYQDRHLVAYGHGSAVCGLALSLRTWSSQVTACTDAGEIGKGERSELASLDIEVREEKIVRLEGNQEEGLQRIVFRDGSSVPCAALFFNTSQHQQSNLPRMLGCTYDDKGKVRTEGAQQSGVGGLYLAGDADGDVQFLIVAAAEGATAAVAINHELQNEDGERVAVARRD